MAAGTVLVTRADEECKPMKVELVLSPIEEEVPHHKLVFEMPGVPRAGDCVTVTRPGQAGSSEFIVSRTCWTLDCPETGEMHHAGEAVVGITTAVIVECEYVAGPYSFEEHKYSIADSAT
jgi:hypothetical protein